MRRTWGVRLLLVQIMLPSAAFAHDPRRGRGDACTPETAVTERSTTEEPRGPVVSIETAIGLGSAVLGAVVEDDASRIEEHETAAVLSLIPALDWRLGGYVRLGVGVGLHWAEDRFSQAPGRRAVTNPEGRFGLVFPITDELSLEALFTLGLAFWSADGAETSTGWTRRAAFGASYQVTPDLAVFTGLGFFQANAFPDDGGPGASVVSSTQALSFSSVPLSLGLRAGL